MVFDVGIDDGRPFLVTELLEGETLRRVLRHGPPPPASAVAWSLGIAHGLAAAHSRNVVHRDLKPDNVFLTTDNRVKILDFGLAKILETEIADEEETAALSSDTAAGTLLGTMGYSPRAAARRSSGHPHRCLRLRLCALRDALGPASLCRWFLRRLCLGGAPRRPAAPRDSCSAVFGPSSAAVSRNAPRRAIKARAKWWLPSNHRPGQPWRAPRRGRRHRWAPQATAPSRRWR